MVEKKQGKVALKREKQRGDLIHAAIAAISKNGLQGLKARDLA